MPGCCSKYVLFGLSKFTHDVYNYSFPCSVLYVILTLWYATGLLCTFCTHLKQKVSVVHTCGPTLEKECQIMKCKMQATPEVLHRQPWQFGWDFLFVNVFFFTNLQSASAPPCSTCTPCAWCREYSREVDSGGEALLSQCAHYPCGKQERPAKWRAHTSRVS